MAEHDSLAAGRWFEFSFADQMANVGSEFSRSLRAFKAGNVLRFDAACNRFLELLTLTLSDPKRTPSQLREVCRLKEHSLSYFFDAEHFPLSEAEGLDRYFVYFSVLSRSSTRSNSGKISASLPWG